MQRNNFLITAWCGPVLTLCFCIGFVFFSHFLPPPSPSAPAQEIERFFSSNAVGMRIGTLLMMFTAALFAVWGGGVAAHCRQCERGVPVMTYAQLVIVGGGTCVGMTNFILWAVAAFRPGELPAESVRMLHDIGWHFMLWSVPLFEIWCFVIAITIFNDMSEKPGIPQWVGWTNLLCGFLMIPGSLITFFKTGPFAFNGLFGMYIPLGIYFVWMTAMFVSMLCHNAATITAANPDPVASK